MKKLIFATLTVALLSGCGGGGGGGGSATPTTTYVPVNDMVVGTEYTIEKGDTIIKNSSDAVVELEIDRKTGETIAVLKSGKAQIKQN